MSDSFQTIDDLRAAVAQLRDEAKKMASHLKRTMQEYGDFEDRINVLDQAICKAEKELGLTKEEILIVPNVLDDLMDELG